LAPLATALLEMRRHSSQNGKTRGTTPQLTAVKHELRDWIESRLSGLAWDGDEGALALSLNDEIKQARLLCCTDDSDENLIGFLGKNRSSYGAARIISGCPDPSRNSVRV
jgi:hypothetical protein